MNEYSVNIEVKDGDGKIICSQPYNEFMYGTKNIEIQKVLYGRELYDLLVDGLNVIRYNENGKLILGVPQLKQCSFLHNSFFRHSLLRSYLIPHILCSHIFINAIHINAVQDFP